MCASVETAVTSLVDVAAKLDPLLRPRTGDRMRLTVRTVRVWSSRYNGGDGAAPAPLMSSSSSSVPVQPTMKFPPLAMSTQEIIKATAQRRWLKNAELVDLLDNYDAYGFQCSNEPPQTPPISGTVLLFNKNQVRRWRQGTYYP